MSADVVVRYGTVVTHRGLYPDHSVAIQDGRILAVVPSDTRIAAERYVDAGGLFVLPGVVDGHVHFREPGLTHKEDFGTGSLAAAAGGVTCVVEMPNTHPPTDTAPRLRAKQDLGERRSWVDFGLVALLPPHAATAHELSGAGATGFKVFLSQTECGPGCPLPPPPDLLHDAMREIAATGLRLAVHAEDDELVQASSRALRAQGRADLAAHTQAHPAEAEAVAVRRIGLLAASTACRLHIVHLSSMEGVAALATIRSWGVDATAETCPHYLFLRDRDLARSACTARVNPPIRGEAHAPSLLRALALGQIQMLASDHAPHSHDEKLRAEVWSAPPGIPGVETMLQITLSESVAKGRLSLPDVVRATSLWPSRVWSLYPRKGSLRRGADADLTLVSLEAEWMIREDTLHGRSRLTPFLGWRGRGRAVASLLRGEELLWHGEVVGSPRGRLVPGAAPADSIPSTARGSR